MKHIIFVLVIAVSLAFWLFLSELLFSFFFGYHWAIQIVVWVFFLSGVKKTIGDFYEKNTKQITPDSKWSVFIASLVVLIVSIYFGIRISKLDPKWYEYIYPIILYIFFGSSIVLGAANKELEIDF
jgi:hypothetical protein